MRGVIPTRGGERGAAAVVVAVAMVVILGFAALAIDLGSAHSVRQQLQNGADAGALAIAATCQRGVCIDTADRYAKANKLDGDAVGKVLAGSDGSVTVEASAIHVNWFAGILGHPTTPVSAVATAEWGYPSGGTTLPLTFSIDCFKAATGGWDGTGQPSGNTEVVIEFSEKTCTFPAHNEVPGGFGWLSGSECAADVLAGGWVTSDPGNDVPASCKDFDWAGLQDKTMAIPLFDQHTGSGNDASYRIKGIAALTLRGYCFGSSAVWKLDRCPSNRRIKGEFTSYTDITGGFAIDPDAPHFGFSTVRLSA